MNGGFVRDAQVVADSGGDIDSGTLVAFVFWAFVAKDVFPVIGDKRTAILPLGVADFASSGAVDLDPSPFADRFCPIPNEAVPPGDDARGLWFVESVIQSVVVGKGNIEGI